MRLSAIVGIMIAAAFGAMADITYTWMGSGSDAKWSTAANWGGTAPVGGNAEILVFSGTANTSPANDLTGGLSFNGLTFGNNCGANQNKAFTLSGNAFTLNGDLSTGYPATTGVNLTDVINNDIVLGKDVTITTQYNENNKLYHSLTINGIIGGGFGLTKKGKGHLLLNGLNTYTGKTTINGVYADAKTIKNIGVPCSFGAPAAENATITFINGRAEYVGSGDATDRPFYFTGGCQFDNAGSGTLTLNGTLSGSSNMNLTFRGANNFIVNGRIIGFNTLGHTDGGTVTLVDESNEITNDIAFSDGTISVATIADAGQQCALGTGSAFTMGQSGWTTVGRLLFTGTLGGSCNRGITLYSPNARTYGGRLENAVAGQTLTMSGLIKSGTGNKDYNFTPNLWVQGVGDGVLSGTVQDGVNIIKAGSGTWSLTGTMSTTGSVQVTDGTLAVDSSTGSASPVTVSGTGTLGGIGTIHGPVSVAKGGAIAAGNPTTCGTLTLDNADAPLTFADGAALACKLSTNNISDCVAVSGTATFNGTVLVTPAAIGDLIPAGTFTLMTYTAKAGTGTMTLSGFPRTAVLTVGETSVTLTVAAPFAATLTWVGDGIGNLWDFAAPNWSPATALFQNNLNVAFDDGGSASPDVTLSADVEPATMAVTAKTKAYTLSGAGITGATGIEKTGTASFTLNNANTYSGDTHVTAGQLILRGSISGSSLKAEGGGSFNETTTGTIGGNASVTFTTSKGWSGLSGANTYDGLTTIGSVSTTNVTLSIYNAQALGSTAQGTVIYGGGINLGDENQLVMSAPITVSGETLTLMGGTNTRARYSGNCAGTAVWDGDIVFNNSKGNFVAYLNSDSGTNQIGTSEANVVTGKVGSATIRGAGTVHLCSRMNIGTSYIDRNNNGTFIISSANNVWGKIVLFEGTILLDVDNGCWTNAPIQIGKNTPNTPCWLNLNGHNQTFSAITEYVGTGCKRHILSDTPAVLTINGSQDSPLVTFGTTIEGQVSVVKDGTGTMTLGTTNTTSGAFSVLGGTLAATSDGAFGASTNVTVTAGTLSLSAQDAINDGAVVSLTTSGIINIANGVTETVDRLYIDGKPRNAGTYGGTGSGAQYVRPEWFSGTGVLKVLHGSAGFTMTIQ